KRICLRRGAARDEPDGTPRPRAEVGQRRRAGHALGEEPRVAEHRGEGDRADAAAGLGQELAPAHRPVVTAGATRGVVFHGHLLRASSRLKNWLATMVQAASSGAGTAAPGGESPTVTSALEAFESRA